MSIVRQPKFVLKIVNKHISWLRKQAGYLRCCAYIKSIAGENLVIWTFTLIDF